MNTVFIGGSRRVTRLNEQVRQKLDAVMHRGMQVLLGDANGADRAVQAYLAECGYRHVLVFCTGGECRNNVGEWRVRAVSPPHSKKDFAFFAAKDAAMSREAGAGIMLWDGKSAGTMVNVARLANAGKTVAVYHSPSQTFTTVRSWADLRTLVKASPRDARQKMERYIDEFTTSTSPSLFG